MDLASYVLIQAIELTLFTYMVRESASSTGRVIGFGPVVQNQKQF